MKAMKLLLCAFLLVQLYGLSHGASHPPPAPGKKPSKTLPASHAKGGHKKELTPEEKKNLKFYNEHGTCDGKKNKDKMCCNKHNMAREHGGYPIEEEWCKRHRVTEERCKYLYDTERGVQNDEDQEELDEEDLLYFLVVFVIIAYGAAVRGILRATGLPIPYTVILMISGFCIGIISKEYCRSFQKYTAIARTPSSVILFTFLPVLIFESAFSIPVHTFMRSSGQILIAAFPGMIISTFATAGVCILFLKEYKWDFVESLLFGAIISATDPVAVVAILRELGTSEMLSVMIEGESLLNDGVAILMYKLFEKMLVCELQNHSYWGVTWVIVKDFCIIALGGPAFGWVMARLCILCLSKIFNDATVEITITLAAAYLTYFIGDHIFHVSGVMAVVALGLVLGAERTCISPEVEDSVHHFWEMLGYLANTVLFVLVGIIISETALDSLDWYDLWYLGFLYIALNIIRLVMLLILMPLLQRIGYGLRWENMIIMMWGGLRGAVGLCLAIEVFRGKLCEAHPLIGPKFLFQTAGIVVLTLVVNGTTTKILLDTLKLTEISAGRLQNMANATKQLVSSQMKALTMLKHDRFLADANWKIVEKYTAIEDPYIKKQVQPKTEVVPSILSIRNEQMDHVTECDVCHNFVKNEHTKQELRDLTEEGRLRLLKALKVSYWRQFEQGVLTEFAVLILISVAEKVEDLELTMVHARDFRKYWTVRGVVKVLRKIFLRRQKSVHAVENLPPQPKFKWMIRCWKIATSETFNVIIMVVIFLNLIPIIWELVRIAKNLGKPDDAWEHGFNITNIVFTSLYTLEFVIKIIGLRQYYYKSVWNWIDFIVLLISWVDVGLKQSNISKVGAMKVVFQIFKLSRIIRIIRLPRHLYPKIKLLVEIKSNEQLFLGYDVGKGFVNAIDDVLKYLPQMVDHPRILQRLKRSLDNEKLETVRQMGLLQKEHPGIAIAVKTRHASRAILNMMRDALTELKEDGLVDEKENELLTSMIEHNMKRLWSSPSSIPPSAPSVQLANVPWVLGSEEIMAFIRDNAELRNFSFGDKLCAQGDQPDGVYLIVSGMIKINYHVTPQIIADVANLGKLPNTELFLDLTFTRELDDFFSTGTCVGEIGALTGAPRASSVTCETFVMAYYINQDALDTGLTVFNSKNNCLESRMWRAVGINIGTHLLPKSSFYQAWALDKIRMHLERSAVPVGAMALDLDIPEFVSDIVLIQGKVRNFHKNEVYTAPGLLPRTCVRIVRDEDSVLPPRFLVVAVEDVDHDSLPKEQQSLHEYILRASTTRKSGEEEATRPVRNEKVLGIGARKSEWDRIVSSRRSRRNFTNKDEKKTMHDHRRPRPD